MVGHFKFSSFSRFSYQIMRLLCNTLVIEGVESNGYLKSLTMVSSLWYCDRSQARSFDSRFLGASRDVE